LISYCRLRRQPKKPHHRRLRERPPKGVEKARVFLKGHLLHLFKPRNAFMPTSVSANRSSVSAAKGVAQTGSGTIRKGPRRAREQTGK
jgi:hypothetical protein